MPEQSLIPPSGGFRNLRSFQCAQVVYDGTLIFCERFVDKRSRTFDQMVQAARSGVQNIAEGSLASATSKRTELKLTSVARASLGELLLDLEDYLRQNGLLKWEKHSILATKVRLWLKKLSDLKNRAGSANPDYHFTEISAENLANTLICLINQTSYLLWQQMKTQEKDFLSNGGFTEKMYRSRQARRSNPNH